MTGVSSTSTAQNGAPVGDLSDRTVLVRISSPGSPSTAGAVGHQRLYFKAPSTAKAAGTDLLRTHVEDWIGDLNHYFANHTTGGTPDGATPTNAVSPSDPTDRLDPHAGCRRRAGPAATASGRMPSAPGVRGPGDAGKRNCSGSRPGCTTHASPVPSLASAA